jgi:rubrerythrin
MNSEKQLAELGIRILKSETHVILMCERCGEVWEPKGNENSWVCPKGCNLKKTSSYSADELCDTASQY